MVAADHPAWSRLKANVDEEMGSFDPYETSVENIATDLETARKRRDEMLAAFDSGKPIPYINAR